jgi:tyrosine phenol-lyase
MASPVLQGTPVTRYSPYSPTVLLGAPIHCVLQVVGTGARCDNCDVRTIIEPFRIKSVEPLRQTTPAERQRFLEAAGYNLFLIDARHILIDLLTDSGTSAMSTEQWAAVMRGDESYAGSESFFRLKKVADDLMGFRHMVPAHQGRAAERILFTVLCRQGHIVPNNTHFDTTRANIEFTGAKAVDLPVPEAKDTQARLDFKGNMDVAALEALISWEGVEKVPLVMLTVTNNSGGGQPVSMANIEAVKGVCARHGIPLYLDACRFAENAWFIREREPGYSDWTPKQIAQKMFRLCDGCTFSAKKDAFANIGGMLCTNDGRVFQQETNLLILTEGFPTYGGLAGRDLDAIAVGLEEVLDEDYLRYRIASTGYLGRHIADRGVPIVEPPGGHAIYIDAARMLPHVAPHNFPGQALAVELYRHAGIRAVEIGSLMFGKAARHELLRLAIPRRVYTQSHIDYVVEAILEVNERKEKIRGLEIVEAPPVLRHFSAKLRPL